MHQCKHVYCRALLPETGDCPECGYPRDASRLDDEAFVLEALPDIGVEEIIDMHQILARVDGNLELQLRVMERARISKALLQSVPSAVTSIFDNAGLRAIKDSHRDRFYISQFSDPRIPFVKRKLERYRREGQRVIKLLPCMGFQPDAAKYDRFWGKLEELRLVAMVHTGFITARHKDEEKKAGRFLSSKLGRPIFFDRIARKFPDLQIILCHLGGAEWCLEGCQMVTQHDNVWGDIAGPGLFALRRIVREQIVVDWSKIFWGNDSLAKLYPFNMRLARGLLERSIYAGAIPALFHDNGAAFIERFVRPE